MIFRQTTLASVGGSPKAEDLPVMETPGRKSLGNRGAAAGQSVAARIESGVDLEDAWNPQVLLISVTCGW